MALCFTPSIGIRSASTPRQADVEEPPLAAGAPLAMPWQSVLLARTVTIWVDMALP